MMSLPLCGTGGMAANICRTLSRIEGRGGGCSKSVMEGAVEDEEVVEEEEVLLVEGMFGRAVCVSEVVE